jgi:hypothetical protein
MLRVAYKKEKILIIGLVIHYELLKESCNLYVFTAKTNLYYYTIFKLLFGLYDGWICDSQYSQSWTKPDACIWKPAVQPVE